MSIINLITGDILKLRSIYPMRCLEIYDNNGNALISDNNFMYLKYEEGYHYLIYKGDKEINLPNVQDHVHSIYLEKEEISSE